MAPAPPGGVDAHPLSFHRGLGDALTDWRSGHGSSWCRLQRGLPQKVWVACAELAENYRTHRRAAYDSQVGRPGCQPGSAVLFKVFLRLSAAELGFLGALAEWSSSSLRSWLEDGEVGVHAGVELGLLFGFFDAAFDAALAEADEPINSPIHETCSLFAEGGVDRFWMELVKLPELAARNRFFTYCASGYVFASVETLSSVFRTLATNRDVMVSRVRRTVAR